MADKLDMCIIKSVFSYDPDSGKLTWLTRGGKRRKPGDEAGYSYKQGGYGYVFIRFDNETIKGERLAWALHHGEWPDGQIVHINGDRSDNRIDNLKEIEAQPSLTNKGLFSSNTTGYKGVYYDKSRRKYRAVITINGKKVRLGCFDTAKEAGEAYKERVKEEQRTAK